jgi:hypothetical protein
MTESEEEVRRRRNAVADPLGEWSAIFVWIVVVLLEVPKIPGYYAGNATPTDSVLAYGLQKDPTPWWVLVPHIVSATYAALFACVAAGICASYHRPLALRPERPVRSDTIGTILLAVLRSSTPIRRDDAADYAALKDQIYGNDESGGCSARTVSWRVFQCAHVVFLVTVALQCWKLGGLPWPMAVAANGWLCYRLVLACANNNAKQYLLAFAVAAAFTAAAPAILFLRDH